MIKKILVRDYLKGYGDMTTEERKAFVGRVGEWLVRDGMRLVAMTDRPLARSQSLMTVTTRWTAEDCRAMAEGISLLSAMVAVADTWLPTQIYMKSAYRAVRQVVAILAEIPQDTEQGKAGAKKEELTAGTKKSTQAVGAKAIPANRRQGGDAIATQQTKKEYQPIPAVAPTRSLSAISHQPSSGMVPARPKHIDQYVHLLPKATQERAGEYGELMRQLSEARDNMQLLMDDDHASAKSREQWAKQATKLDKKIRAIRDELDREWEKVVAANCIALDAFGNAYVVEMRNEKGEMRNDATADGAQPIPAVAPTRSLSAVSHQSSDLTSEQKKRRRELRKWLIDLRRGKEGKDREKRIEQWRVNWQEYLTLEPREKALEDEKILEAAKHFGIDLEVKSEE